MPRLIILIFVITCLSAQVLHAQLISTPGAEAEIYPPVIRSSVFFARAQYQSSGMPIAAMDKSYREGNMIGFELMRRLGKTFLLGFTVSSSWASANYVASDVSFKAARKLHFIAPKLGLHVLKHQGSSLDLNAAVGIGVYRARMEQGPITLFDQGSGFGWAFGIEWHLRKIFFFKPYLKLQYLETKISNAIWQCDGCQISSGENSQANFDESQINFGVGLQF